MATSRTYSGPWAAILSGTVGGGGGGTAGAAAGAGAVAGAAGAVPGAGAAAGAAAAGAVAVAAGAVPGAGAAGAGFAGAGVGNPYTAAVGNCFSIRAQISTAGIPRAGRATRATSSNLGGTTRLICTPLKSGFSSLNFSCASFISSCFFF